MDCVGCMSMARKDPKALRGPRDSKDLKGQQEKMGIKDLKGRKGQQALKAHRVLRGRRGIRAQLAHKGHKDHRVSVLLGHRGL